MKRRFTILTAALALLAILAIPMGMMGQTTHTIGWGTASGDAGTYTNFSATSGNVGGILSFATAKNSSSTDPAYNSNSSELRIYYASNGDGGSITITPVSGLTITNAVITTSTSPSVAYYVDGGSAVSVSASNNTYTISGISASTSLKIQNANTSNTQLRIKTIALTYITEGPQPTTYSVTFDAGDGTFVGSTDFPNASNTMAAGTYTLPSAERSGYTFDGWTATGITTPITGSYTVSEDIDFTAQYTQNSGSGATATLTQSNLELTGSYTTNTSKTIDGITYVYTDLMKSSDNIQAKASTGTIKNTTAYPGDITEVKITHSGTARATTINGSADGTNWTQVATGSGSITADFSGRGYKYFQITRGSNAAYWEKIDITYSTSSSSQSQSDLAITNASTDLTFDLYNNATAQVINYTTSSTGAITITPAESSYFTYVHDATAKTITVTPTAVTPSAQTVTISQEADEDYYAGTASFTVSVANSDPNLPGTVNNPYTVAEAIAATPSSGNVYIQGIVSSFYNTSIVGDGNNYRYYISDDGTTTTQLLVYRGKGLNEVPFTNADDLLVGDEVVIYGTLIMYNNTPEINSGNYLYSWNRPASTNPSVTVTPSTISAPYTGAEGTLALAYENIEEFISFDYYFCDANGDELEDTDPDYPGDWIYAEINEENDAYILSYLIDANDGAARTAYMKVYTFDDELEEVYAIVTVTQAAYEAPHVTWDLSIDQTATATESEMTWTSDYATMGVAKASASTNTNNYYPGTEGHSYTSTRFYKNSKLTLSPAAGYAITSVVFNATSTGYASALQESTWTNANATMEENGTIVTVTPTDGTLDMVAVIGGTCGFTAVTVYYVAFAPEYTLTIEGYGNSDGGYYLIASPVTVDLTNHDMTTGEYDLYYFDQAQDDEWRNYKQAAFSLEPGKGYLYAHSTTVTLTFDGEAYNGDPIVLKKNDGGDFPGWNLVGNPYTETAYIDRDFYVMKSDGSEIIAGEGNEIAVMQGFFVIADQDGEELEISTTAPTTSGEKVVLNVTSNRGNVIDRAIVRFGEGRQLPKFQLRENSTKISIAKDNSEYAVVRSEAEGEMPVSFKAENNGTYTFSINTENVEMEYLHLIDNMTGADIDLIANPSYSFEAKVTDYASRFRLVFSANSSVNEQNANNFAFFNGNDWTINNEGEATLQVVDMTGRVLSTETVNGNATTKVNAATGVYMLRLINGNNIKTQKVVVK